MDIFEVLRKTTNTVPEKTAVIFRNTAITYMELIRSAERMAGGLAALGVRRGDRVAIFLDKSIETVSSLLGVVRSGAIFVPINPQLKPHQVEHIVRDSGAKMLITNKSRHQSLSSIMDLTILCDAEPGVDGGDGKVLSLVRLIELGGPLPPVSNVDSDPAAILYTSGSTGLPKGVLLSHRNLVAGAESVNQYLGHTSGDTILSLLPLSFDAGLSQLTTAFQAGATVVLVNYLHVSEVIKACQEHRVTSITGVPPLWSQLMRASWPDDARSNISRFANTGGHMNSALLKELRSTFPNAKPYLMYGLTEAFRSTYLDPAEIDRRSDSIGKAVPNAEVLVLRPDGTPCDVGEIGELVHRGAFVTLGYWNDLERTRSRFRPLPSPLNAELIPEIAVWSGDLVRRDEKGFLYFVGRTDEMIKSSGYRISPNEIESVLMSYAAVKEAVVVGVPHQNIGHQIIAFVVARSNELAMDDLQKHCKKYLPTYMVPSEIHCLDELPRNMNGKFDRKRLSSEFISGDMDIDRVSAN